MASGTSGLFVWFDYVTKDAKKAQAFFGELFNWTTKEVQVPQGTYTMIAIGDQTIGGYTSPMDGGPQGAHWLSYLQVSDVSASAKQIRSIGGRIRMEAKKLGDLGTMAVVSDPYESTFGLWQPAKPDGRGFKDVNGAFCWNELSAEQPTKSAEFYKQIGGFTVDKQEPGGNPYYVLKSNDKPRAGVMKSSMLPTAWMPYVQVGSVDQSHDKAKRLGASIKVPPTDIPDIGRFSIFADPQGGLLGLLQPKR